MDDHIVSILVPIGLAQVGAGRFLRLQERWGHLGLVGRFPVLK